MLSGITDNRHQQVDSVAMLKHDAVTARDEVRGLTN